MSNSFLSPSTHPSRVVNVGFWTTGGSVLCGHTFIFDLQNEVRHNLQQISCLVSITLVLFRGGLAVIIRNPDSEGEAHDTRVGDSQLGHYYFSPLTEDSRPPLLVISLIRLGLLSG